MEEQQQEEEEEKKNPPAHLPAAKTSLQISLSGDLSGGSDTREYNQIYFFN